MRRGSTSRSQTSAGSASPCSGTSTSRRRSMPGAGRRDGGRRPASDGRNAASARWSAASISLRSDGERRAAQAAQDLGVAPLALAAAGAQLAADELAGALERLQRARSGRRRSARAARRS